jgi:hypothetical protein
VLAILNSVSLRDPELFALRLLLAKYPARSWKDLRTKDGIAFDNYQETVKYLGMISNVDDEARLAMVDAIEMNRPPSDLRFLFVQLSPYVSNSADLEREFWLSFFDLGDTDASVRRKLDRLRHPVNYWEFDNPAVDTVGGLEGLNREQLIVANEIVESVIEQRGQLFFLQGSAGTGKTFTVRAIIAELRQRGQRCLICATTGIAAVQYTNGSTVHALFKLGIDETAGSDFRCNIGRGTAHARYIASAHLIIIDEVSMLTLWVAHRVSLTLQSVCENELEFGGKSILFVGDLLQLPPVSKRIAGPILHRLIVRLPCWNRICKFHLSQCVRSLNPEWADFLRSV